MYIQVHNHSLNNYHDDNNDDGHDHDLARVLGDVVVQLSHAALEVIGVVGGVLGALLDLGGGDPVGVAAALSFHL